MIGEQGNLWGKRGEEEFWQGNRGQGNDRGAQVVAGG